MVQTKYVSVLPLKDRRSFALEYISKLLRQIDKNVKNYLLGDRNDSILIFIKAHNLKKNKIKKLLGKHESISLTLLCYRLGNVCLKKKRLMYFIYTSICGLI